MDHAVFCRRCIFLFAVLTLLVVGFIFANSLQDSTASGKRSDSIAQEIKPIVDPNDSIEKEQFHKLTRKFAHGIEFCALGVCLGALIASIGAVYGRHDVFAGLFTALAVAVADEFLQKFTGRSDEVADIVIDFGGAVTGFLLVGALLWFRRMRSAARPHADIYHTDTGVKSHTKTK